MYDETRAIDEPTVRRAVDWLARRFPPDRFPRALEIGIGTGRIAFPFSSGGYTVAGVDRSAGMLERLRTRARSHPGARVEPVRGDARRLPFRSGVFDLVYWVHVLHLVPHWQSAVDEALRVVRPGGTLVHAWTEGGSVIPELSDRYRRILRDLGYPRPRLGARNSETVFRYLRARGCRVVEVRRAWRWTALATRRGSMAYVARRPYTMMRCAPSPVHRRALLEVRAWARARWPDPDRPVPFDGSIRFALVRVPTRPGGRRT